MHLNKNKTFWIFFLALMATLYGCKSTKYVPDDEYLLRKNDIVIKERLNNKTYRSIDKEGLDRVIKQKTNRRLLGLNFALFVYNLTPRSYFENFEKNKLEYDEKIQAKITKRKAKGKKEKEFKPYRGGVWGGIINSLGEAPVVFDSAKMEESTKQLEMYLYQNGFFNSEVAYSTNIDTTSAKKQKITVTYTIKPHELYLIKSQKIAILDTSMTESIMRAKKNTLLTPGLPFEFKRVDKERERMTKAIRDEGYFSFSQDYITFEIDSTVGEHQVSINQLIHKRGVSGLSDSVKTNHRKFRINNVYFNSSYSSNYEDDLEDTITYNDIIFINKKHLTYKPYMLTKNIFIRPGDYYNQSIQEYTYNRIASLNNFKFINIKYQVVDTNEAGEPLLNCFINVTPMTKQSVSVQGEGTNTGGALGVNGSFTYTNRNILMGSEIFKVRLTLGLEAQQTNSTNGVEGLFNTLEYGGEVSLRMPSLLIPRKSSNQYKIPKYNRPQTFMNLGYNFQDRPDYTRISSTGSFNYAWTIRRNRSDNEYKFYPINVSLINIDNDPSFQEQLDSLNNPFLTYSYSNHYVVGMKFSQFWSNFFLKRGKNVYMQNSIETAGNILNATSNLLNEPTYVDSNDQSYHTFFNIRYAQFIKLSSEWVRNVTLQTHQNIVYRLRGGIGIAYGNLPVLPFDKSYFVGGANDIRGWLARSLGPGSTPFPYTLDYDQVGDILLEANVEYRFSLSNMLKGALFMDAGNIWMLREDKQRPGSQFKINEFYKDIAIAGGAGLRFDFSFLIIRLDLGLKVLDPNMYQTERWIWQPKTQFKEIAQRDYSYYTFNLGIGYPF